MHVVLRTAELRDLIFYFVFETALDEKEKASAAALARTCRDFMEPALRVLWATHWSFDAFVQLLPEDKITRAVMGAKLIGILTTDDLARVRYYGAFVREFILNYHDAGLSPHNLTQIMIALDGHALFPNLRSFGYCHRGVGYKDYFAPCLPALISRTVTEVYFDLNRPFPDENLALEMSILFSLKTKNKVSTLHLDVVENVPSNYAELLEGWTSLRHLRLYLCCSRVAPALVAVSALQGLRTLTLDANSEVALECPPMGPANDSLQQLVIRKHLDDDFAADVIAILHPKALTSLHVDAKLAPEAIRLLAVRMSTCCAPHMLKYIILGNRDNPPKEGDRVVLQDILPLLSFTGLVSVSIHVFDIRFDDADITRLAAAWPRLRTLSLCGASKMTPACTLASLLSLARGCPDLEELSLALDATEPPSDATNTPQPADQPHAPARGRPPYRLRKLDVMRSPICSEPEHVASFLTRYFPFLRPLGVKAGLDEEKDEESVPWGEYQRQVRWRMVRRLMPTFLEARKTGIYGIGVDRG
ncbi:hypothetical protein BD626DRAFT_564262 [Schizophyllum amplum]|uniref:F-box domain-containing protein n=1 Tax=Schizophyllum amplum TaxID=97359 RepID=A0A550D0U7_9AGAR|nr:hypothetical protein BD626DRAFT_564262 [Auriculariopsis ampla]